MAQKRSEHSSNLTLSIIQHPCCKKCSMRMAFARSVPGPKGYEFRTFECGKCNQIEKILILTDPMSSNGTGWTAGHLEPPE